MTMNPDQIVSEALALPPAARALMAELLIESLDSGDAGDLTPEWRREIQKRCREIDQGLVVMRDAAEVMEKARVALG